MRQIPNIATLEGVYADILSACQSGFFVVEKVSTTEEKEALEQLQLKAESLKTNTLNLLKDYLKSKKKRTSKAEKLPVQPPAEIDGTADWKRGISIGSMINKINTQAHELFQFLPKTVIMAPEQPETTNL